MKRTTIYFEPELEVRLKMEALRRKQPMAELVREAVEAYLSSAPGAGPPGAGAFSSGHADTGDRAEAVLAETGFGTVARPAAKRPAPRSGRVRPSRKLGTGTKRRA